jgi:hypothetical protein
MWKGNPIRLRALIVNVAGTPNYLVVEGFKNHIWVSEFGERRLFEAADVEELKYWEDQDYTETRITAPDAERLVAWVKRCFDMSEEHPVDSIISTEEASRILGISAGPKEG